MSHNDGTYCLSMVLPHVGKGTVVLDGETFRIGRFIVFAKKGITCVGCGLRASFFRKEMSNGRPILNLYARTDDKRIVLFTRDHIIPESRGGTKDISNMQPMCADCNGKKGDAITFENRVKQTVTVFKKLFKRFWFILKGSAITLKAIWRK